MRVRAHALGFWISNHDFDTGQNLNAKKKIIRGRLISELRSFLIIPSAHASASLFTNFSSGKAEQKQLSLHFHNPNALTLPDSKRHKLWGLPRSTRVTLNKQNSTSEPYGKVA